MLALMLLQDSRRDARVNESGDLVLLEDQDRTRWDRAQIEEGLALLDTALAAGARDAYVIQAAIAALHARAPSAAETDWAQIAGLYAVLATMNPSPGDRGTAVRVRNQEGTARDRGGRECLPIRDITVDLVRQREPSPPVEVRFRTTPANLELRTDEAATCRTPCDVRVTPGLHRFELFEPGRNGNVWRDQVLVRESTDVTIRHESHRGRQEAAGWFLLPATVGAVLLPIGLLRKNDTLVWTSGGLLAGGTLGFS